MNLLTCTGCERRLVWGPDRQAMAHTEIYNVTIHPAPHFRGRSSHQAENASRVHLEVDTLAYSWPEEMEAHM